MVWVLSDVLVPVVSVLCVSAPHLQSGEMGPTSYGGRGDGAGSDAETVSFEGSVACCDDHDLILLRCCLCLTLCVGASSPLKGNVIHYYKSFLKLLLFLLN